MEFSEDIYWQVFSWNLVKIYICSLFMEFSEDIYLQVLSWNLVKIYICRSYHGI